MDTSAFGVEHEVSKLGPFQARSNEGPRKIDLRGGTRVRPGAREAKDLQLSEKLKPLKMIAKSAFDIEDNR
jgi:hypothetical protein